MAGKQVVAVHGLTALKRDLRTIDRGLGRELNRDLKQATERAVLPAARSHAPRRTGRLADSLRVFTRGSNVGIRSPLPYAGPVHWGWPAHGIQSNPFIDRAFDERGEQLVDAVGDAVEDFAARHGFR